MVPIRRTLVCFFAALLLLGAVPVGAAQAERKAGAVTTAGGRLNVRSGPSSSSAVVASVPKGSYITLVSRSGSWWQVQYDAGKYGYCHADYITVVAGTQATVATASGSLNVRSGPGTSYAKAASLPKGEKVIVLTQSGDWTRVIYHGTKTGYVSSRYLSSYYAPVSLSVPNFKQNDSRWANVTVGTSGKTMAQIGCATTAVAMMESCRTGQTIYPDAMMKRLSYTPSGDLYWPADYTPVTRSENYLTGIYNRLRQGKPVLFGARNASGKQHWVVITGFTGGTALTADRFTIHDPGSWQRTSLQHFLAVYPNFYKYFY